MPNVDFFYVKTDVFDDEKIRILESMPDSDALIVLWFKLLTQAAKCNADSWIWLAEGKPYSDEHLAAVFGRPVNTIRMSLKLFEDMNMLHRNGDGIFLVNWLKIQNANVLSRIREATRNRVARLRERHKALPPPKDVTLQEALHKGYGNADTDNDKDTDTDNDKDNKYTEEKCNVTDKTRLPCGQTVGRLKRILLKDTREYESLSNKRKRFFYHELLRVNVPIDELMKEKGIEIDFPLGYEGGE